MSEDFSKNNLEDILKKQQGTPNLTALQRKMNKNKADISNAEFYGDIITTIINSYEGGCVAVYDSQAQWFSGKQDMLETIKHKKSTSNILEIDISLEYQLAKEREPLKPFTNGEYILCVDDNGLVYKGQGRYPMTYQTPDNEGIIPEGNDIMFGPGSRVEGQPLHPKTKVPTLPKGALKTKDAPYDPKGDKSDIMISPPDMSHLHDKENPDFSQLEFFAFGNKLEKSIYRALLKQYDGDPRFEALKKPSTGDDDEISNEEYLSRAKRNTGFLRRLRETMWLSSVDGKGVNAINLEY